MTITNPSYGKCYPFGEPAAGDDDQRAYSAEWRHLAGAWGDGIVNDFGGGGGSGFVVLTKSTSTRVITIRLCEFRTRGIHFEPTEDTLPLTIPAVAAGSTRIDRIVAKFDPATQQITFEIKPGTATTGTPAPPSVTQVSGGVWETSLYLIAGGNVAASVLTYTDQRRWLAPHITVPSLVALSASGTGYPNGTRLHEGNTRNDWLMTYPGGVGTWVNLDDPPWTPFPLHPALKSNDTPMQMRLCRGEVQWRGGFARISGAALTTGGVQMLVCNPGSLPVAYRPDGTRRYPAPGASGGGQISVYPDGSVGFYSPATSCLWANVDPVRYYPKA